MRRTAGQGADPEADLLAQGEDPDPEAPATPDQFLEIEEEATEETEIESAQRAPAAEAEPLDPDPDPDPTSPRKIIREKAPPSEMAKMAKLLLKPLRFKINTTCSY